MSMLIIATGISGCGRKEHLKTWERFCDRNGKRVKVYHVGEMLFAHAKKTGIYITQEKVLNTNPDVLTALRSAVFEYILGRLRVDLKENDAVVLNMHTHFYWKEVISLAYNQAYIKEFNPDMFITFIDSGFAMHKRLNERDQWKDQHLSLKEVLLWQNMEVVSTKALAETFGKKFFAIAVNQPPETFFNLAFRPEIEPVYASMPITHLKSKKDQEKIRNFIKRLNNYFTVFNPLTIEVGPSILHGDFDGSIEQNQTIPRDLDWLLGQSNKIIAYFPKVISSPGAIHELREAHDTTKDVWIVYPEKVASPFLSFFATKIFRSETAFFRFLDEEYFKNKLTNR